MKQRILRLIAKFVGYPTLEPLFLLRMRQIEKSMFVAINEFSFKLLDTAYDRIIWEYQFDRSKEELDLICELLRMHANCKRIIENNLIIETFGSSHTVKF